MDAKWHFYLFHLVLIAFLAVAKRAEKTTVEERMEIRCKEYANLAFNNSTTDLEEDEIRKNETTCGIKNQNTAIGSQQADSQEFPHMALIGFGRRKRPTFYWKCSGSLISESWVLSGAYCFDAPIPETTLYELARYVLLGDLSVKSDEDLDLNDHPNLKVFWIHIRVLHPNYNKTQAYNNLVLFKMNATVEFNQFIRPICLHGLLRTDDNIIASGWGKTFFDGIPRSNRLVRRNPELWYDNPLLKVETSLIDAEACSRTYSAANLNVLPNGINATKQICVMDKGNSTCQGNFGSPLQVLAEPYCMYNLVGVVAIGDKCESGLPTVYTNIHAYLDWIECVVWSTVWNCY